MQSKVAKHMLLQEVFDEDATQSTEDLVKRTSVHR